MPLGGDGGVMLLRGDGGVMPSRGSGGAMPLGAGSDGAMSLRGDNGAMPSSRGESARGRQWWCDAIVFMKSWCEVNKCCGEMPRQDVVMASVAIASSMKRCVR
jgi:hypothetical protein